MAVLFSCPFFEMRFFVGVENSTVSVRDKIKEGEKNRTH
jgi:hypothetical protein